MATFLQVVQGGNHRTKEIENFLLGQDGVLDASVWCEDATIRAHVTLGDYSNWTERSLRLQCALELGLPSTPSDVTLFRAHRKSA